MLRRTIRIFTLLLVSSTFLKQATAQGPLTTPAVWQYSVPLEPGTERRAYLWIPPMCTHVRGVLFGLQNMLERPMFEDPDIRSAAASVDLAIVLVSPGAWPDKSIKQTPSLNYDGDSAFAIAGIENVLKLLAEESGYSELEDAPIALAGHSAASPFVWGVARAWPDRVFAFIPFKGYHVDSIAEGVPTLKMEQEWAEWGPAWGEVWQKDMLQAQQKVAVANNPLFGDFVDIGTGHFDWHHEAAAVIAMFLRKAAAARLPERGPLRGQVRLLPISAKSGVLVVPSTLGGSDFRAVPYKQWKGDPRLGFWYFDAEMAKAVSDYMETRLAKKPEAIDFTVDGQPVALKVNGFAALKPEFLEDGVHFTVHAKALESSPSPNLLGAGSLGHANAPILFHVGSGALVQTGPDTFMMGARSGGLTRQGQPWEPWIIAYDPGDEAYRSADRPAHILIDIRNKIGASQILNFSTIKDVPLGTASLQLKATSDSGLAPQLYVESGPAVIDGDILRLLPIPPRSKFPVKVTVSAYQWGRVGSEPVQSAGPLTREFFITK